jgi:phospholipase C
VHEELDFRDGGVELFFRNSGKAGAVLQVRFGDGQTPPRTYTVGPDQETSDVFGATGATAYDLTVFGPNGFLRTFTGGLRSASAKIAVRAIYEKDENGLRLEIRNHGSEPEKVSIMDAYTGKSQSRTVHPHHTATFVNELHKTFGWYDLTITAESDSSFLRQLAGHLETGRASVTDPAIGATVATAAVA